MERLGLVGLPLSGKSELFEALTGVDHVEAQSTLGVAQVPDERLLRLAEMSRSQKVVPATIEWIDIPGVSGQGKGAGNRFLGTIRELDAMCLVLGAYTGDPASDLVELELELVLADSDSATTQLERRRKAVKGDKSQLADVERLERAVAVLDEGTPLYRAGLGDDVMAELKPYFLLTAKPVLAVVNVGEGQDAGAAAGEVQASLGEVAEVVAVNAAFEKELRDLDDESRTEFLADVGLTEPALPRVARAAYHLLGRRTFLTTGDKESRAWTFRAGAKAPECAGVIHSDLQRGFIRAEVIRWDELLTLGSWSAARDAGKLRVEGKEYEVQDGDVVEIRFNV